MSLLQLSDSEIESWKVKIMNMDQIECARLHRFAQAGHPVFRNDLPLHEIFEKHFKSLGGMTSDISKEIGWK